jgi:serine phosphatase RsbU (regulator of sigma subunit)
VARVTVDSELRLEPGDVMLLYTDGITEARDARDEQLGLGRVCDALAAAHDRPVGEIRDALLALVARWAPVQADDVTLLVLRYKLA